MAHATAHSSHVAPHATTAAKMQQEGPATLAARARVVALASAAGSTASNHPRPNQPLPANGVKPSMVPSSAAAIHAHQIAQHQKQPTTSQHAAPTAAAHMAHAAQSAAPPAAPAVPPPPPAKPKKPHTPLNYKDPSLSHSQQFELRLQEARWRQRKRRRERRRQRTASSAQVQFAHNGHHHRVVLTQQQAQDLAI